MSPHSRTQHREKESQERSKGIITTSPNITYFSVSKRKGDFSNVLSNVFDFNKINNKHYFLM